MQSPCGRKELGRSDHVAGAEGVPAAGRARRLAMWERAPRTVGRAVLQRAWEAVTLWALLPNSVTFSNMLSD